MARVTRNWDFPANSLFGELQRELSRVLDWEKNGGEQVVSGFAPKANLAETDKAFEVTLELPGLKSEDIQLEFRDGHLWVTGERKPVPEEKGKTYHRVESQFGPFRRVVALGADVDAERIEANYADGILLVIVPKVQAAQPKRIVVKG